ncbi:amino acid ABC transporter ATP-binding protein [Leucobacter sp. CSA1]|uniref:Amino acid ABC transporter ATP-binding protein n=1 Tax=Leucobacter chromiisoli TaxID=2796471 RepID=A0A934Q771_9MICO|nr:amino acid ABC transporter ATP-binding protein [Leucobacter chromiisoli]
MLDARNLHKSYGDKAVLRGVDLSIRPGQVKAMLGPSGSGKSTTLRLINLLERADAGTIEIDGKQLGFTGRADAPRPAPERILAKQRQVVGMVFQQFNLFPHLNAVRNVMSGLTTVRRASHKEAEERAVMMLERVGLGAHAHKYPSELSGGQQQRVAIARALVMDPKLMLFDEPTSALDPELVGEVLRVMEDLAREGMTMLVVTHETRFARRVADEVVLFDEGVIVEQQEPEGFFENPRNKRTKEFLRHVH